jgi:uncharacterized protein
MAGMNRALITLLVSISVLAAACSEPLQPEGRGHLIGMASFETARGAERTSLLNVADSEEERRLGLMGVESLAENGGMVFVFQGEETGGFWMNDTLLPLSIAFWGDDGKVLDILEMDPCEADLCPTYVPDAAYTHALEMNAGWFTDRGIEIGDRVELAIGTE